MIKKIIFCSVMILVIVPDFLRAADDLNINTSFSFSPLGSCLEYLEDPDGNFTIEDAVRSKHYTPVDRDYPSFGYKRYPIWLRFAVNNTTLLPVDWLLEFDYPIIDEVILYVKNGNEYSAVCAGDHFPFDYRQVKYRTIVFPVKSSPGRHYYYLRVYTSGSLTIALNAYSTFGFEDKKNREGPILWLFYGFVLAISIYTMSIYFSIREHGYLFLSLFSITYAVYSMTHNGLAFEYFWPEATYWANISNPFLLIAVSTCSIQLSRSFLGSKIHTPKVDVIFLGMLIFSSISLLLPFFIDYFYVIQFATINGIVMVLVLFIYSLVMLMKGVKEARIYTLAFFIFILGGILSGLRSFGILPRYEIVLWSMQIGAASLMMLLTFGINIKVNKIRHQKERALVRLRESEEKYRTILENAHNGVMLIVNEKPVYGNQNMIDMTGYEESEFYHKKFFDFLPDTPTGKQIVFKYYTKRLEGKDVPSRYEAQMITKNGIIRDIIISAVVLTLSGTTGVLAVITDITKLKKAEDTIFEQYNKIQSQYIELEHLNKELLETHTKLLEANENVLLEKEQLSVTLRSIGDAVITYNKNGDILLFNTVAEKLTCWPEHEAIGKNVLDVIKLKNRQTNEWVRYSTTEFIKERVIGSVSMTFILVDKNKNEKLVEINGAPVVTSDGKNEGVVLAIRDITEKSKLENDYLNINKLESLGVLAGGIAHDFNNLLSAIIGNISIAKIMFELDESIVKIFERIENACDRAENLTQQLLTFSKGGEPIKKTASIPDIIKESEGLIFTGTNVNSKTIIEDNLWNVDIDVGQISQVFNNILINAMQAMPDGGMVTIKGKNIEKLPQNIPLPAGRYITIDIEDEGHGISMANQERLFDPYFTTKSKGSGLGLATAYSIIKQHNGFIDVSSRLNKGSVFTCYLPASENNVPQLDSVQKSDIRFSGKVIVMDDENYIREIASSMLTFIGFNCETVAFGEQLLDRYKKALNENEKYDLVILDLTTPGGMGGEQTIRELLKIDPDVKAIVSSGYSENTVLANYKKYGFKGILTKPFKLEHLTNVIASIIK